MDNNERQEMDRLIAEARDRADKLIAEIERKRILGTLITATVQVLTVVGIFVVVNKLDGSLKKE